MAAATRAARGRRDRARRPRDRESGPWSALAVAQRDDPTDAAEVKRRLAVGRVASERDTGVVVVVQTAVRGDLPPHHLAGAVVESGPVPDACAGLARRLDF